MRVRFATLLFGMLVISVGLWAADDPLMGTWKLNLAKSKYSPGPAPKEQTYTYEPSGADGVKYTQRGMDAQGKSARVEYTAKYDGKDYPVTGDPGRDAVSWKRIDMYTTEGTNKKGGKVTTTFRRVVSKDGKTLTVTVKGTDTQGQAVNNIQVYDKQ